MEEGGFNVLVEVRLEKLRLLIVILATLDPGFYI